MSERICKVCGLPFPETTEYFYQHYHSTTGKYYLDTKCRECVMLLQHKRDFKNRFAKAEACKAYYWRNKLTAKTLPNAREGT